MIHRPLLGVVNAPSAVSTRTLTRRAPAAPRKLLYAVGYMAVRVRPLWDDGYVLGPRSDFD
jgi:hypothetical protein